MPSVFSPIAIVGQGCVLPGALSPGALWKAIAERRDLITGPARDEWGVDVRRFLRGSADAGTEQMVSDRGGYVRGFDAVFDPSGFAVAPADLQGLDPIFTWLLHSGRDALHAVGGHARPRARAGIVVGNLSYPTRGHAEYSCDAWLQEDRGSRPENRFSSGYPAQFAARALNLGLGGFALDAACASSLYALKLACDRLHDGEADLMLAAAVNHADSLFLHVGFTVLQALSPSGQSRPFHRHADGLLPAEGAACVALKRLEDAERDGDTILGVIRGIGLSNNGIRRGLLVPDASGQIEALTSAYESAGMDPAEVSLLECHATGTALGDGIEITSAAHVFHDVRDLPVGSLKSNLGHLVTAAGLAALIKVLHAMKDGVRPPTLHATDAIDAFEGTPLRPLHVAEAWESTKPRVAGISAFGFGGCNAHLVVEEWRPKRSRPAPVRAAPPCSAPRTLAVCGIGVVTGAGHGYEAFCERLFGAPDRDAPRQVAQVELAARALHFPPVDLAASLPQQTLMLEAALAAVADGTDRGRTGVIVGMGCDPEITRFGMRWRLPSRVNDDFCPSLTAAHVIGTMPNVPANRLNVQLDAQAFGYTLSAEELSGATALRLAARALSAGDVDTVIVGAVEVIGDRVHESAATALLPDSRHRPGDAAVALAVTTPERASALGLPVRAFVEFDDAASGEERSSRGGQSDASADQHESPVLTLGADDSVVTTRFGHAHAASGLLHIIAAIASCERATRLTREGGRPWLAPAARRQISVIITAFDGSMETCLVRAGTARAAAFPGMAVRFFGAADAQGLLAALAGDGGESHATPGARLRLAIVAEDEATLQARIASAREQLTNGRSPAGPGVYYAEDPVRGGFAFTFPGVGAVYDGAGYELLRSMPELTEQLAAYLPDLDRIARTDAGAPPIDASFAQLYASTLTCQAHARLCLDVLGLRPDAAIGLSSGETNALIAFGAWRDAPALFEEIAASGMYGRFLTGACETAAEAWKLPDGPVDWAMWRILAAPDAVRSIIEARQLRTAVTIINTPDDCVIGGERAACAAVIGEIGSERAIDLNHPMVVHCEEVRPFAPTWRRLHTRATHSVPGIRFYSNAFGKAYDPTAALAAEALTRQALEPIDFPRTVRRAWDDGVRVFLEVGPRNTLTSAISRILHGRPHVAIALDGVGATEGARVADAIARLHVAGIDIAPDALTRVFGTRRASQTATPLRFPARLAPFAPRQDVMAPAPHLPPILDRQPVGVWQPPVAAEAPATAATPEHAHPAVTVAAAPRTYTSARTQLIADVQRLHREFIEQQTHLYRVYSDVQMRLLDQLRGGSAPPGSIAPSAAPALERPGVRPPTKPTGPAFGREALETLAGGRISDVFGPAFRDQDGFRRQVRLPEPPLLLVDRVIGIAGQAGTMGRGTIWTETDIRAGAWYLHDGHMPPGILIESGQADLLLISWLGVDALNRDERVYRLLGCELTFHADRLPKPGDTLHYEIHIDGHARTGHVRLFFFHYDCWIGNRLCLSVRNGQAGFFSDAELAGSSGALWDPETDTPDPKARIDAPPRPSTKRAFSRWDVEAFAAGDAYTCFGTGFEEAASHQRTPTIPNGRMQLIDEVTAFDPTGGPWGRGYLRAEADVPVDAWFYAPHFKNDPCMPGTLMADAALQAQAFLMAACGFTIGRDGWRFEPVTQETYKFVCRGQVIPDRPHRLTYEVFVEAIEDGPEPRVHAALLCSSDGFKVFQCRRQGLRLVPDWPLSTRTELLLASTQPRIVDPTGPVRGDYAALLACAWGRPTDAFGPMYEPFDGARRAPRLPGPPYHFMSEVERVTCPSGTVTSGGAVTARYDVPPDAWYFQENASATMPLAVLMEVMLQPCGWLASYMGIAANAVTDVRFRNLDGSTSVVERHVRPETGPLTTTATLTRFAKAGEVTLVFFRVECRDRRGPVLAFDTSFGFFTDEALAGQTGLPEPAAPEHENSTPSVIDLDVARIEDGAGLPRLARGSLLMIDRVSAFWPEGGAAGLGEIRGHQAVIPAAWYFKAHFYQDPVQPGSLGVEALIQLLQIAMRLKGLDDGMTDPAFEPIAPGEPLVWRYRGQVLPRNQAVDTEIEITRIDRHADRVVCVARGALRCDGLCIYETTSLAVALVDRAAKPAIACTPERMREGWRTRLGIANWPGEALMTALFRRFVRRVEFSNAENFASLAGQPVLYLANHQTGVESMLFGFFGGGLLGRPVVAIAKGEHQESWIGRLGEWLRQYPGVNLPRLTLFFDRDDRASLLELMKEANRLLTDEDYSMLVHVEGTRSTKAGDPVKRVSAVLLDLVLNANVPVVPVRFAGGLPADPGAGEETRREFPVGFGQQEIFVGEAIDPDALRRLPLRDRQQAVADAINGLGGPLAAEAPGAPSPETAARVAQLCARAQIEETRATVLDALAQDRDAAPLFRNVIETIDGGGDSTSALAPWERVFVDWVRGGSAGQRPGI